MVMGSLLSPVFSNFLMEGFEERALEQATYRRLCWFYYVDHTFVIWLHGTEELERFLDHMNGLHRNIQFTLEMEKDHFPSFLDIDICRRPDGSLAHKVYRKPTHTNLYQKLRLHHHSSNIQAVLSALVQRARAVGDIEPLHDELEFLMTTSRENGYSLKEIHALNPAVRTSKPKDKPTSVTLHPYVQMTYGWLSRC